MLIANPAAGLLLVKAAAPATAQAPAAAPTASLAPKSAGAEKPKKPKLSCTEETQTDSFIPNRVCRTHAQVVAERQAGRRDNYSVKVRLSTCQGVTC
jgi:hypothetical protein